MNPFKYIASLFDFPPAVGLPPPVPPPGPNTPRTKVEVSMPPFQPPKIKNSQSELVYEANIIIRFIVGNEPKQKEENIKVI
jgi:hypothetical protein